MHCINVTDIGETACLVPVRIEATEYMGLGGVFECGCSTISIKLAPKNIALVGLIAVSARRREVSHEEHRKWFHSTSCVTVPL